MLPEPHNFSSTADFVKHSCEYHAEHPSILNINNKCTKMPDYSLSEARSSEIRKIIKNLNPRKTTGHDMLPAKALIPIRDIIDIPLCHTYNACIKTSSFPSQSKKAEVVPIYKKDDPLTPKITGQLAFYPPLPKSLKNCLNPDFSLSFNKFIIPTFLPSVLASAANTSSSIFVNAGVNA